MCNCIWWWDRNPCWCLCPRSWWVYTEDSFLKFEVFYTTICFYCRCRPSNRVPEGKWSATYKQRDNSGGQGVWGSSSSRLPAILSLPRVINFNFLFQCLTRDISYSMENLAIDSLLRWKVIEQSFLTTSLNYFLLEWLGEFALWAWDWKG